MSSTVRYALLFIISAHVFESGSCQALCDVCQCVPSTSQPTAVQCTGTENITKFPTNISNTVASLSMMNLPITKLQATNLEGLTSLITLYIIDSNLSEIESDSFQDQENLQVLRLRNNSLSTLSASWLNGLKRVLEINLEINMITDLPDNICKVLPSLETLKMSQNSLTSVGADVFKGCSEINSIDLSNNEITTIDEDAFQNLKSLSRLEIKGNKLTTFYSAWIEKKSASLSLAIDSDNYICTEQLKTEYDTMLQSHPQIIGCDTSETFCPKCQNFNGKALINITTQEFMSTTTKLDVTTTTQLVTNKADNTAETTNSNRGSETTTAILVYGSTEVNTGTSPTAEATLMNEANVTTTTTTTTTTVTIGIGIETSTYNANNSTAINNQALHTQPSPGLIIFAAGLLTLTMILQAVAI